jgi:hypothetical protein
MSGRHELHVYEYVNHSFEAVRDVLSASPLTVFRHATTAVALRNQAADAKLHATVGPLDLGAEVEIEILAIEASRFPNGHPALKLVISWKAARRPALFPTMQATLLVYALTPTETQLDLAGSYEPPLGLLGEALDAIAMHRVAERSVAAFLQDVAAYLRDSLDAGNAA